MGGTSIYISGKVIVWSTPDLLLSRVTSFIIYVKYYTVEYTGYSKMSENVSLSEMTYEGNLKISTTKLQ